MERKHGMPDLSITVGFKLTILSQLNVPVPITYTDLAYNVKVQTIGP